MTLSKNGHHGCMEITKSLDGGRDTHSRKVFGWWTGNCMRRLGELNQLSHLDQMGQWMFGVFYLFSRNVGHVLGDVYAFCQRFAPFLTFSDTTRKSHPNPSPRRDFDQSLALGGRGWGKTFARCPKHAKNGENLEKIRATRTQMGQSCAKRVENVQNDEHIGEPCVRNAQTTPTPGKTHAKHAKPHPKL